MIELVIPARHRDLGGLSVSRVLPFPERRMVGPFIFLDHVPPVDVPAGAPRSLDVRPHPHIGLATITYPFAGEITHRDSLGYEQVILPEQVNWMTAGRGITHSERFERLRAEGGRLHATQAWVALPNADEECEPSFEHYSGDDTPVWSEHGVSGRVIAGSAFGLESRVSTRSPLFYVHVALAGGAEIGLPSAYSERGAYVVSGTVEVEDVSFGSGNLLVFARGAAKPLRAPAGASLMLLGGEPLGERHIWWNFVSSRPARIEQAKADWRERRFPLPQGDASEFTPLPEEPPPPAEPMS